MVCRLHKALYVLKQAPRTQYERLHTYLIKIGFERKYDNNNLYMNTDEEKGILLSEIFVDDIIFGGQDALCKDFPNQMKKEFEMLMFGEIKFFVGLQVYQMKCGVYIYNSIKICQKILKTFGLEDSKLVSTPMVIGIKLLKNDDSTEVNQTLYRSVMGKLQYVVYNRPDITLFVGIVARFSANPRENHMMIVRE